jgi:hypothetical protein
MKRKNSPIAGPVNRVLFGMPVVCMLVAMTVAADAPDGEPDEGGLWPTPRMIQVFAERVINDLASRYGLDDTQKSRLRDRLSKWIPQTFERHRARLQPVLNEVIEQHLSGRVPTTQQMADWSSKALPAAREVMEGADETYKAMRPYLRPDQVNRWGRDQFQFRLGFTLGEAKLRSWAEGRFEAREWHAPLPGPHQGEERIRQQAAQAGLQTQPPPEPVIYSLPGAMGQAARVAPPMIGSDPGRRNTGATPEAYLPLDQWESHARRFIAQHQLDEGQKTSVMAILKEVQGRARAYRRSHRHDYDRLEKILRQSKGDDIEGARADLAALDGPLREQFEEFCRRLDGLLTDAQRRLDEGPAR